MPNSRSAKKRLRQNQKLRDANRSKKSAVRSQLRRVREAIQAGEIEQAESAFRVAVKKLDQIAGQRIIHANKAARLKSRLSGRLKVAKQAAAGA